MQPINKTQKAVFNLMKCSAFNDFNPDEVAKDLTDNADKWLGCIWGRFNYCELLPLRDIEDDFYGADTLYLSTQKENIDFIRILAGKWQADEIGYYCDNELYGVVDEQLNSFKKDKTFPSIGTSAISKDIAYFRIWWD